MPALRAGLGGRSARWLGALAFVLPVPLAAMLGLSLPLPATVERLAVKLIPFVNSDAFDPNAGRVLARGAIVLASPPNAPVAPAGTGTNSRGAVVRHDVRPSARLQLPGNTRSGGVNDIPALAPASGSGASTQPASSNASPPSIAPEPGAGGSRGGTNPTPAPPPARSPVDTVTTAVNGAADTATSTATTATNTATGAVSSAGGALPAAPGVTHP